MTAAVIYAHLVQNAVYNGVYFSSHTKFHVATTIISQVVTLSLPKLFNHGNSAITKSAQANKSS